MRSAASCTTGRSTKIRTLFAKIYAALPAGGGILVVEKLLDEDGTGPVPAQMQSLNMLVCTEGRERSASEYRALLEEAGFSQVEARRTGAPLDAVLALKRMNSLRCALPLFSLSSPP